MTTDKNESRRRMLKLTGASFVGITGFAGIGSADPGRGKGNNGQGPPEHSEAPDWVKARSGKLELKLTKAEYKEVAAKGREEIDDLPEDAELIPYQVYEDAVKDFNKAIDSGRIELENRNGRPYVTVSNSADGGDEQ